MKAVNHLDRYLREFEEKFTARGGKVYWASNGAQAREYILNLAREKGGEIHRQIEGDDRARKSISIPRWRRRDTRSSRAIWAN